MESNKLSRIKGFLEGVRAPIDMILDLDSIIENSRRNDILEDISGTSALGIASTIKKCEDQVSRFIDAHNATVDEKPLQGLKTEEPETKPMVTYEKPPVVKTARFVPTPNGGMGVIEATVGKNIGGRQRVTTLSEEAIPDVKKMLIDGKSLGEIGLHYGASEYKQAYMAVFNFLKTHDIDGSPTGRMQLRIDAGMDVEVSPAPKPQPKHEKFTSLEEEADEFVPLPPKEGYGKLTQKDLANVEEMMRVHPIDYVANLYLSSTSDVQRFLNKFSDKKFPRK